MSENRNVGFGYDFDLTLSEEFQQYPFFLHYLENLKEAYPFIEKPEDYWRNCIGVDLDIAWMQQVVQDANKGLFPGLTNEVMEKEFAPKIKLAPGITEWFDRINEYGKQLGLNISHHVISTGAVPLIRGTKIFPYLAEKDGLFAAEFIDGEDHVTKIKNIVGTHDKVKYLKTLTKGVSLDEDIPVEDYRIQHQRMFIFGDGQSDVNMFRYFRQAGGRPIGVFQEYNFQEFNKAKKNLHGHISMLAPRNFTEGSRMDTEVKQMLVMLAEHECDYDYDVVHRAIFDQLRRLPLRQDATNHFWDCTYCKDLTTTRYFLD